MSRIAKTPVIIPTNVNIKINNHFVTVKGNKGELSRTFNKAVIIQRSNNMLNFIPQYGYIDGWAQAGTVRSLLNSMIIGVTEGFTKKLQLVGVGYRVVLKNNVLYLSLGFSHVIKNVIPYGIDVECPSQNEIILKGIDKEMIGKVAAVLRAFRKPEPYKGKGIRYADELVYTKEAKKK